MFNHKRTQIARHDLSVPMYWILNNRTLDGMKILHFGEGKALMDTRMLRKAGRAKVTAYDPYSDSLVVRDRRVLNKLYDLGIAIYVFNTLPPDERVQAWNEFGRNCMSIMWAVRCDKIAGEPYKDGVITKANTFQKSYTVDSALEEWPNARVAHKTSNYILLEM